MQVIDLIDRVPLSFIAFFFTAALQSPRPLSWLTIDGLLNIRDSPRQPFTSGVKEMTAELLAAWK